MAKRLELLRELLPGAADFAVLLNSTIRMPRLGREMCKPRPAPSGSKFMSSTANSESEIDTSFANFVQGELVRFSSATIHSSKIAALILITLAARYAIPAMYP